MSNIKHNDEQWNAADDFREGLKQYREGGYEIYIDDIAQLLATREAKHPADIEEIKAAGAQREALLTRKLNAALAEVLPADSLPALRRAWTDAHERRVDTAKTEKAARTRLDEAIERQKKVKS